MEPTATTEPTIPPAEPLMWLRINLPTFVAHPFADRHIAFWRWFEALRPGVSPSAFIAIWPRGGAKSTTCELGTAYAGAHLLRRFAIYVSATQEQANRHVQAIATIFERLGIERALNAYGHSKGWKQNQLRTATGFNIVAFGLDTGSRGIKLDEYRPDLIVIDDVDDRHDTPAITQKKIETLTQTVFPSGAPDMAIIGVQNLIHAHSIFSRLLDGRADFLLDREVSGPFPAIDGLKLGRDEEGLPTIIEGRATWAGQSLDACLKQIHQIGVVAFRRESQHEVGSEGRFFRQWDAALHTTAPVPLQPHWVYWVSMDYGFVHPCVVLFHAADPRTGHGITFAEIVVRGASVQRIVQRISEVLIQFQLPVAAIQRWVAGHDIFATGRSGRERYDAEATLADQFALLGVRWQHAKIERINGWAEALRRLGDEATAPSWRISTACTNLIATIPALIPDPDRPADVKKVNARDGHEDGDDAADAWRYGLMEAAPRAPVMAAPIATLPDADRVSISPV